MKINFEPSHEAIAICAYLIYANDGFPEGRALDHWLQAESQLQACNLHEAIGVPPVDEVSWSDAQEICLR